jgi:hypothetical protein
MGDPLGNIIKKYPSKHDSLCPSKHVNQKQHPVPPNTQKLNILVTVGEFMKLIQLPFSIPLL